MSAPKIKIYRLSRDFTTDSLNKDKKTETNDELVPVFDKYVSPDDIMANRIATGILPSEGKFIEKLDPIFSLSSSNPGDVRKINANLVLMDYSNSISSSDFEISNSSSYSGSNSLNSGIYSIQLDESDASIIGNLNIDICMNDGVYPLIMAGEEAIPNDGWELIVENGKQMIKAKGIYCYYVFTDISFMNNYNSVSNLYCSKHAPVYCGNNSYFTPFVFTLKDGYSVRYQDNIVDNISYVCNHEAEMVFYTKASSSELNDGDYFIDEETGLVMITEKMMNDISGKDLYINYVCRVDITYPNGEKKYRDTKRFIAENINLIPQNEEDGTSGGHLFMGPDVFLGKKQYEPSSYEDADTGEVITIGIIPAYVEPGNYTFSHRNGYVTFPAKVNSNPEYNTADYAWNLDNLSYTSNGSYTKIGGNVHISYAHVCCVENVNNQVFDRYYSYEDISGDNSNSISDSDIVSGLRSGDVVFKPSNLDKRYLKSIGAPWVKRNNTYMPIRVYVTYKKDVDSSNSSSGEYEIITEQKPQIITISNYDELKIKTNKV